MLGKQLAVYLARRPFGAGVCFAVLAASCCLVRQAAATDADIVNAMGFETPGFTTTFTQVPINQPGQLEGQSNPIGFGQLLPPGQWLRTKGPGLGTAVVQNSIFSPFPVPYAGPGGNQAVKVDGVANSFDRWGVFAGGQGYPDYPSPQPPEPPQPCICITWDMRVGLPQGDPQTQFGPFFGVEAYDDDATTIGLLGSFGVAALSGDVVYQDTGTGFFIDIGDAAPDTWHRYQIKLDYSTHQYSVIFDGAMLATLGFVDQNNIPGGLDEFTDAPITTLPIGTGLQAVNMGTGYFDNYVVREGTCPVIPEPSALVLAALGLLGLAAGQRRGR